jgi:nucleoside-diphosphate-sugar epimerase
MKTEFHEPVNLGNPNEMNMLELARVVRGITGTEGKLVFKPMPGDDPKRRRPDISKAQTILGWSPKISLQQGLTETIRWFSDELNTD